jgi:hypothetical protein
MPAYYLMPVLNGAALLAVLYARHLNPALPGYLRYFFLVGLILGIAAILPTITREKKGDMPTEQLQKYIVVGSALVFVSGAYWAVMG